MLKHVARTYTATICIEKKESSLKKYTKISQAAACKILEVLNLMFTVCVELKEGIDQNFKNILGAY